MKRRSFLKSGAAAAAVAAVPLMFKAVAAQARVRSVRPPGALEEEKFVERCIRCNKCGEACPNSCIRFMGFEKGLAAWGTPHIIPRQQACILCMKCGQVCPTGAIRPVRDELKEILANVKMGRAVVDESHCLSYQGKTCGVCYRACPLADVAMTIGFLEQPTVTASCVGCGLCERSCIQLPQAVRIIPTTS
jgi:MauM/NapG family ferredoxin protein